MAFDRVLIGTIWENTRRRGQRDTGDQLDNYRRRVGLQLQFAISTMITIIVRLT